MGSVSGVQFSRGTQLTGLEFPHLYALLEGENVDSFRHMFQDPPGSGWKAALNKPNIESWLV